VVRETEPGLQHMNASKAPQAVQQLDGAYRIRRAESARDARKLHDLFAEVFHPEEVGVLAETMFHHLPRMEYRYWFIAEEVKTERIVSAFALIPWTWEMEGVRLKVAEMGIVGTLKAHRWQGLMRALNTEFDATLREGSFDLAVIQGTPGFYQQFGFSYAVPLENHINLPLHVISEEREGDPFTFRLAGLGDIPFLMKEDEAYRAEFSLSAVRDEAIWRYLLTHSLGTEYGSEFWIMERCAGAERFYCRIPAQGFGTGLIVSEVSAVISAAGLEQLFAFCGQIARERNKPYIRLNVHDESRGARVAIGMGAKQQMPYAWQIKFPSRVDILTRLAPLLEERMKGSCFQGFSGTLRLDFFKTAIDLVWSEGVLESVGPATGEAQHSLAVAADLFPALCLGHRTWRELRYIRPDVFPRSDKTGLIADVLFPARRSWIHEQY